MNHQLQSASRFYEDQDFAKAEQSFWDVLKSEPQNPAALLYSGVIAYRQNNHPLAARTPDTRPTGDRLAVLIAAIHRGDVFGIPS